MAERCKYRKIDAFLYVDMRLWRENYKGLAVAVNVHNLFNQEYIDSRNYCPRQNGHGRIEIQFLIGQYSHLTLQFRHNIPH